MSENEPTTGELARRFDRLDSNIESGFRRIDERLDRMVSTDVFTMSQAAFTTRLDALTSKDAALEQKLERVEEVRRTDRRALFTSAISAVVAALIAAGGWVVNAMGGVPPTP